MFTQGIDKYNNHISVFFLHKHIFSSACMCDRNILVYNYSKLILSGELCPAETILLSADRACHILIDKCCVASTSCCFIAFSADFLFKFLVIGNAGTGKSCLLHQFIEKRCKL